MKEIIFSVSLDPDDLYVAQAFCYSISVKASSLVELRRLVREAVDCHFEALNSKPVVIRLHLTHHEDLQVSELPNEETEWRNAHSEYSECASMNLESRPAPILGLKAQP